MKNTRSGYFKKQLSGEMTYYSFCPSNLPPKPNIEIDDELSKTLINAYKALATLDEKSKNIPNIELFVSMYVQKEALLSSQIEGTRATLEDIFNPDIDENINLDVEEVVNYIKATKYAIERLKTLPLCNRLLLETHKILLSKVRGKEKRPGEFRNSQNWIGGQGSAIKNARYIPPDVDSMKEALFDLEKYTNKDNDLDELIKISLIHYQFETIHPFLDGNERIGRLLIVLYLLEKKVISTPCLYLSYYLKENRIEYYDRMSSVRETGNYEQWIKFFVKGIYFSAKSAIETAEKLIKIREKNKEIILNNNYNKRTNETIMKVMNFLENQPIINISKTAQKLNLAYNTIFSVVKKLEDLKILKLLKKQDRNKVYIYKEYLDVLKQGTEIRNS